MRKISIVILLCINALCVFCQEREFPVETVVQAGHTDEIVYHDTSADGRYLMAVDKNKKAILWDIVSGRQVREYTGRLYVGGITKVFFDKRQKNIVYFCDKEGNCDIFDIRSDKRTGMIKLADLPKDRIRQKEVYEVKTDGEQMEVSDKQTQQLVAKIRFHGKEMGTMALVGDGQKILVSNEHTVMWDLKNAKPLYRTDNPTTMKLRISPDPKHFLISSFGNLEFRNMDNGETDFLISVSAPRGKIQQETYINDNTKAAALNNLESVKADSIELIAMGKKIETLQFQLDSLTQKRDAALKANDSIAAKKLNKELLDASVHAFAESVAIQYKLATQQQEYENLTTKAIVIDTDADSIKILGKELKELESKKESLHKWVSGTIKEDIDKPNSNQIFANNLATYQEKLKIIYSQINEIERKIRDYKRKAVKEQPQKALLYLLEDEDKNKVTRFLSTVSSLYNKDMVKRVANVKNADENEFVALVQDLIYTNNAISNLKQSVNSLYGTEAGLLFTRMLNSVPPAAIIKDAIFSSDGKELLLATTNGIYTVDINTKNAATKEFSVIGTDKCGWRSPKFRKLVSLENGKFLLCNADQIFEGDFVNPFELRSTNLCPGDIYNFSMNPAGNSFVMCSSGDYVLSGFSLPEYKSTGYYARPNPYTLSIFTACNFISNDLTAGGKPDGSIHLFNATNREFMKTLNKGHNAAITDIQVSPDGKYFYSSSEDGKLCMWNAQTQELVATFVVLDNGLDYVIITPDNYYMASKNAFDGIHFVKGTEIFGFDQFDLQYNRPDIVLSRIGYSSPDRVQLFRKGYEKRLRKMKFTEEMFAGDFHIPTAKIQNKTDLQKSINKNKVMLNVLCADSRYKLNRINVWINNVPVYGLNGIDVGKTADSEITESIELSLTAGENRVEVSCLNEHGAESYRDHIDLFAPASVGKPDLYVLSIGVSEYAHKGYELNYAHKDAADVAAMFQQVNTARFGNIFVTTLVNSEVTRDNIIALRQKLENAKIDDVVVVFYAGHGLLDSQFDYYLATYDTDFDNPAKNALPYDEIENLLDGIAPLQKILLVDACHSGEIDKEEILLADASTVQSGAVKFRDVGVKVTGKTTHESAEINQLLKQYFADLTRGVGATVIASSSGLEVAMEGEPWKNGLFTYVLKDGILNKKADEDRDGVISVSEMQTYANREVARMSDNRQQPAARTENKQVNFIIAY
ncbi:MAG: caspase family protein [Dysgonamonadaceae bacterium]|jgi:WD40 repeat protein|nr:caspase family protein [Dysgonamonadaceae bacterium]